MKIPTYLFLSSLFLPCNVEGVIEQITPDELSSKMEVGFFRVVADVRTSGEFEQGHLPNATLVENLALAGTVNELTNASDLWGCKECNIAVYCRSGARADAALAHLDDNGFVNLYDAQGINQWVAANFSLVQWGSQETPCKTPEPKSTCEEIDAEDPSELEGDGSVMSLDDMASSSMCLRPVATLLSFLVLASAFYI